MSTIADYPPPRRPLSGEEPVAVFQDGRQVAPTIRQVGDFVSDQVEVVADRAERAADDARTASAVAAAAIGGVMYPSVAAGLAATADQGFFTVATGAGGSYAILYQRQGAAAVEIARIAAAGLLEVTPEQFGAVGDGRTDDQPAFDRLNAAIKATGRASITFRQGATYLVGRQVAGVNGQYLTGTACLDARGLDYIAVDFNGATLRFKPGMRFGSFDPSTGQAITPAFPFLDRSRRADIGWLVRIQDCKRVVTTGAGTLDGNSRTMIVGGGWGDTGWQCIHYGMAIGGYESLSDDAVLDTFDCLLDCYVYSWTGLTEAQGPKPARIRNKRGRNAGRNVVSVIGGSGMSFDDCLFRDAGAGYHASGRIGSNPKSCFDIEAEDAIVRRVTLGSNVALIAGPGGSTALVADSGNSADIEFRGRAWGRLWTSKPRTRFIDGELHGTFGRVLGGQASAADNTVIQGMTITDEPALDSGSGDTYLIDVAGAGAGVQLIGNAIRLTRTRLQLDGAITRRNTITVAHSTATLANCQFVAIVGGDSEGDTWIDAIPAGALPADAYYVEVRDGYRARGTRIVYNSGRLRWYSWSPGGGGFPHPGQKDGSLTLGQDRSSGLLLARGQGRFGGGYFGTRLVSSAPAMPTAGSYRRDDLLLAEAQVVEGGKLVIGWWRLTDGTTHVAGTDWQALTIGGGSAPAAPAAVNFQSSATLGGGSAGLTYSSRGGYYVQNGRLVSLAMDLTIDAPGSSTGDLKLSLPVTASAGITQVLPVLIRSAGGSLTDAIGYVTPGADGLFVFNRTANPDSFVTHANIQAGTTITVTGSYITA
ncbi:hypothetical protein [Sphingomonas sp. S-NIH.Pt15_0812]|uniref:hypothetical protein n=1 Tax=Sphingomonas sp. S-NIH.Pt15_0812 TaxID=1920129 RepID=UPI000F7D6D50|nr:hypothetical protein [Sphingomonas sp. S-NIH.Pt15_0812]RSU46354.1 hypothetical protein BRX43_15955 [Sphingomonas sp. S-NIH.Pt15_0812]